MPIHYQFDFPNLYKAIVNKLNGLRQLSEVAATGIQHSIGGNSKGILEYLNLSWIRYIRVFETKLDKSALRNKYRYFSLENIW
jgi:hypothetical protein